MNKFKVGKLYEYNSMIYRVIRIDKNIFISYEVVLQGDSNWFKEGIGERSIFNVEALMGTESKPL